MHRGYVRLHGVGAGADTFSFRDWCGSQEGQPHGVLVRSPLLAVEAFVTVEEAEDMHRHLGEAIALAKQCGVGR